MSQHVLAEIYQEIDSTPIDTPFLPENETEVLRQLLM